MANYMLITDPAKYDADAIGRGDRGWWSCSSTAHHGDTAFVYLTGGIGIRYEWRITSNAKPDTKWRFRCNVESLQAFEPPITIEELRSTFIRAEWGAPYTQFRGHRSIQISEDIASRIRALRGVRISPATVGFGDPQNNKLVEEAAVSFVTDYFRGDGWTTHSVERDKCGYDLVCRKGANEKNVEVKGASGQAQAFVITAGELAQARTNERFVICIVTNALSSNRRLFQYNGEQFLRRFALEPLQYRALLRG